MGIRRLLCRAGLSLGGRGVSLGWCDGLESGGGGLMGGIGRGEEVRIRGGTIFELDGYGFVGAFHEESGEVRLLVQGSWSTRIMGVGV